MSAHDEWQHRCTEAECCYFGQPTHNTCSCHRTDRQMMQWEIDALRRTIADMDHQRAMEQVA